MKWLLLCTNCNKKMVTGTVAGTFKCPTCMNMVTPTQAESGRLPGKVVRIGRMQRGKILEPTVKQTRNPDGETDA